MTQSPKLLQMSFKCSASLARLPMKEVSHLQASTRARYRLVLPGTTCPPFHEQVLRSSNHNSILFYICPYV